VAQTLPLEARTSVFSRTTARVTAYDLPTSLVAAIREQATVATSKIATTATVF